MPEDFDISLDIELVQALLDCSFDELARLVEIGPATLKRWSSGASTPSWHNLDKFYNHVFTLGIRLNEVKAQLHMQTAAERGHLGLFHGSKSGLDGAVSLDRTHPGNDFGQAFYCGEKLEQASTFVAMHDKAVVYFVEFDPSKLEKATYSVDQDWMLTVAWFRGRLSDYSEHPQVQALKNKIDAADYVIAPIADNRMYELISEFLDGEITDVVCRHGLSATDLGYQYALRTKRSIDQTTIVEKRFLCSVEKQHYRERSEVSRKAGRDKTKVAKRQFRSEGRFIDELLS